MELGHPWGSSVVLALSGAVGRGTGAPVLSEGEVCLKSSLLGAQGVGALLQMKEKYLVGGGASAKPQ